MILDRLDELLKEKFCLILHVKIYKTSVYLKRHAILTY